MGRDPGQHPVQPPCSGQGQLNHVAEGQDLNFSKDGDSTTSPGHLFSVQPVFSHNKKKLFLMFTCNLSYFIVPIAFYPSVATVEQLGLVARSIYRISSEQ